MEDSKNKNMICQKSMNELEHWRRFAKSGSIDDYQRFSKARAESAKQTKTAADGSDT
ncbi:MAG: hypothetical protein IKZ82_14115 [Clostridia bacterium]|nr:hypothetical protein [Clostridia bacterium]